MKKLILLSIFLTGSYSACYGEETTPPSSEISQEISDVGVGVEIEAGDDDYYDDDGDRIIWIGPGLYYGIWFDDEWEYNDWHDHHYHGHHGHGGGHHGDHHHGGGGHHHGGGGHHH